MANVQRHDPIREKYYRPVEWGERACDVLFWVTTVASVALIVTDRNEYHRAYDLLQMGLVTTVVTAFLLSMAVRLYWQPRALTARAADLLSQSYGVPLSHEITVGYYNNPLPHGNRRLAATLLENSFFSKEVAKAMCAMERVRATAGVLIFILMMREDDLAFASAAAATVFGEQIIVRYLRLEWFRIRCEASFSRLYNLFVDSPPEPTFTAKAVEGLNLYESGKALAGITLSDRIFKKCNAQLSGEWDSIRHTLGI
ncbi:hypothetical protein [Pandoraea sp. 64-18]|uniref:hypothetical protein n=1 Tax=Pandoraea sp. 64-18 TaxID=1895806 RepID=UPI000961ACC5|nr:hypothetical protein [Pandoraea sp. 64-18]OJY22127.1 MAG: hypothetical protein BGP02_00565 [Pandoraea sp. 64-18]